MMYVVLPSEAELLGYELLETTSTNADTNFVDLGPFVVGLNYCYVVTSLFANGAESCIPSPVCFQLPFDVPVLTKTSVGVTSAAGIDTIQWSHPTELDTTLNSGSYFYELYRSNAPQAPATLIYTSSIQPSLALLDSFFIDTSDLNTILNGHNYRIDLYNNGILVGGSAPAASIYLGTIPNDNEVALFWDANVPWDNFSYEVSRARTQDCNYVVIDTTINTSYLDTNLVNGVEYCYVVRSFGQYSHPDLTDTLTNWSQEVCVVPVDKTAPCPPSQISITGDCEEETNRLVWNNPNNSCADDVVSYQLWYTPTRNGTFEKVAEINSSTDTSFVYEGQGSIAGCFYITASDSVQYNNQSLPSDSVCIDNCDPIYELPNVFTPNGDNANDLYHPLLPFKFISRIEFTILNRWGEPVFYTTDPMINWNGFDQKKNLPLNEGVYFYSGTAYALGLDGETPYQLSGFIHLVYNKQ